MDLVLGAADYYFFTPYLCPVILLIVTNLSAYALYFVCATLSYYFVYDHSLMKHPQFLKNQVLREIKYTVKSLPWISIPTVSLFLMELRGYSKLYDDTGDFPNVWIQLIVSVFFLFFMDMLIYLIHRGLHHRLVYKRIHKPPHIWKIPTPFASHAFHPVDGFLQSLPYHIYPFVFPLHKVVYLGLYVLVNIWTISTHDGDFHVPQILKPFINGSAHHTDHHIIGGSFKNCSSFEGKGPHSYVKKMTEGKFNSLAENGCENEKLSNGEFTKTK
uniref:Fatty acid hydroxylase domain-containing protein n=1 Tax=Nannospalax galili TaxID=1026970 RepID=A0A8C6QY23_NANGA